MKRFLNQFLSLFELAARRTLTGMGSALAIALGVLVATTTICALILYAEGVNVAVLRDRLVQAHAEATYDLLIKGETNLIDGKIYQDMHTFITQMVQERVGLPISRLGRHGWSKPLTIILPGVDPTGQRSELPRTRFQFYSGIEDHIRIVEGTFPKVTSDPQEVVEVMMTEKLAETLNLEAGDLFEVEDFIGGSQSMHVQARLAAIIRLANPEDSFWFYAPWFLDEALTVPEETFFQTIALVFVPTGAEVTWATNYDENAINVTNVEQVLGGLEELQFDLTSRLENLQFLTNLDSVLRDYQRSTFQLMALLFLLGAPIVGIALYYVTMSTQLLVEYQQAEIAVLKSRGSDTPQIIILYLLQGLLIVLPVTLAAPFLGVLLAQLIGQATSFLAFTPGVWLPATLRAPIFGYAALTGMIALFAIQLPTLRAAGQTIVSYRRSAAREEHPSFIHRYFLDVVLLLAGGLGYRQLIINRSIISRTASGGLQFDPLLLATPIVLVAGCTFLAVRFVPHIFRLLARLNAHTDNVAPLFALRQISRASTRYIGLILILTFTLSLGLFTATVADAFDRNYGDQAMYAAGTDLRTHEFNYDTASWRTRPLEEYRALPGVTAISPALRVELIGRQADIIAQGTLLAIDPMTFPEVAWWREDFTPSLNDLMTQFRSNEKAVLVNPQFAQKNRLDVGDIFDVDIEGQRVDFVMVGTLGFFPTLFPADGDLLLARYDYLDSLRTTGPSEVWLKTRAGQEEKTIKALRQSAGKDLVVIENGHELTGVRKEDPLRTGLFGALSLGFISATLLSILGFLLYAYVTIQARSLQFGVLRATGLSVTQLITALSTEQLSLIGVGIVLGTVLGGAAGWMFTRFLQLSIIARESIPPFLVITPWGRISQLYVILVVIFGAALAVSVYLLRKMRVSAVLRLGEQ